MFIPQDSAAISFSLMESTARPWRDFINVWIRKQVSPTMSHAFTNVAVLGMP